MVRTNWYIALEKITWPLLPENIQHDHTNGFSTSARDIENSHGDRFFVGIMLLKLIWVGYEEKSIVKFNIYAK